MRWLKIGRDFVYPEYKPKWPRNPPYSLDKVLLDIEVDFENRSLKGKAINRLTVLRKIDVIEFDAVDMSIEKVLLNNSNIDYDYDGNVLKIFLPKEADRGEKLEVDIEYYVEKPKMGLWFIPIDSDEPAIQVWTQGEPEDNRYWIPTYDYPDNKTLLEISITCPSWAKVFSNGVLVDKRMLNGKTVWKYRLDNAIPTYLIAFAAGKFSIIEEKYRNILLQYVVPEGREKDVKRSFSKTPQMIKFFEEFTGVEYPYPKYTQICLSEYSGGMENASITFLTDYTLHDEKAHMDFRSEPLVSHELSHQWFGDLVTCLDWSHLWLNESFATLMAALWRRHDLGENEFIYNLLNMLDSYLSEYSSRYSRPIVMRIYGDPEEMFDAHSYPKGALILWTLMSIIGEECFRNAVKKYLTRFANKNADTEDLRKIFEEESKMELDWFFEQYVYNSGHPVLKVSYKWLHKDKMVEVKIEQKQGKDSLETYTFPLEIFVYGKNYTILRRYWISDKSHIFHIHAPDKPIYVCIDPKFKIFKKLDLELGVEELLKIVKECMYLYPRIIAVRKLSEKGNLKTIRELTPILLDENVFWGLRSEIAKTFGKIGGSIARDSLLKALEEVKHPKVRRSIVSALSNFKEDIVGERLVSILRNSDESYFVRASAALSIAKTRYKDTVKVLEEALKYPSHGNVIVVNALEGLGMTESVEALNIILNYTKNRDPIIKTAAIRALGYFADKRKIIELLSDFSKSRNPRIRRAVISSIRISMNPKLLPILDALSKDVSGFIKRSARDTAKKIRKHMEKGEEYRKLREEIEKLRAEERRLMERIELMEKRII